MYTKALDLVNSQRLFRNKNIDIKVSIFNETFLNIFNNFVPNRIIRCNNKILFRQMRKLNLKQNPKINFIKYT